MDGVAAACILYLALCWSESMSISAGSVGKSTSNEFIKPLHDNHRVFPLVHPLPAQRSDCICGQERNSFGDQTTNNMRSKLEEKMDELYKDLDAVSKPGSSEDRQNRVNAALWWKYPKLPARKFIPNRQMRRNMVPSALNDLDRAIHGGTVYDRKFRIPNGLHDKTTVKRGTKTKNTLVPFGLNDENEFIGSLKR